MCNKMQHIFLIPFPKKYLNHHWNITSTTQTKSQPLMKKSQPLPKKTQPLYLKIFQTSLKIIQHLLKISQPLWIYFSTPLKY